MTATHTATVAWLLMVKALLNKGKFHESRAGGTSEILGASSVIDMRYPVVWCPARKLSWKFMSAEALWIMDGSDLVSDIAPWNKKIADFSDDGLTFFGAYGPRIYRQIDWVGRLMASDPDTRQAVINIWREDVNACGPFLNRPTPMPKDIPCSLSLQWLIRDGKIHCIYHMRSSDIWLGWPYDIFNMTMLTIKLIRIIRRYSTDTAFTYKLGKLHWSAGSSHLYTRNEKAAHDCYNGRAVTPAWMKAVPIDLIRGAVLHMKALYDMRELNAPPRWLGVPDARHSALQRLPTSSRSE